MDTWQKRVEVKEVNMDDYYIINEIGKGKYGTVYQALEKTSGKIIVIKKSFGDKCDNLKKEEKIMGMCHHPNILKCYGFGSIKSTLNSEEGCCLCVEYCPLGDLTKYVEKRQFKNYTLSPFEVKETFGQIFASCSYLRKTFGIIHRDIKPENFLVFEECPMKIKMCDFGFATKTLKKMVHGVGSPLYAAPEIVKGMEYTEKCDLYSLGLVLYFLMTGKYPFNVNNLNELKERFEGEEDIVFERKEDGLDDAKDFVRNSVVFDEMKRMGWDEAENHRLLVETTK
ncbi:calcium-dependent protein kinase, putative [Entamoeba invadens IP1]|uniref:Calcium-dependent protein kinase, putative n=1 Tax=Entamoeba invadens IP1 TaxID=370355 RepID=A0A0A1U7F3_ENTIV|nr:calcium-dependent protein kinase, putative [Entamoeba invadens IP1]ELP87911.1 calcium-dependent protein kinase, putative [Entamoeba invadens IP1]|eukprot:XP_004254682.1 calcium-dependent protein kinase, putative [Entamoeba invadens IP1]